MAIRRGRWTLTLSLFLFAGALSLAQDADKKSAASLSPENLFAKVSPAVVRIVTYSGTGRELKRGSGFLVSGDGLVVTNYHVIDGGASAEVILETNAKLPVVGVAAQKEEFDLAILKVHAQKLPFLALADAMPKEGSRVYAVGNPQGLTNTISEGLVSGIRKINDELSLVQTTAAISPGSSGGPLLTADGQVVGVTTLFLVKGQNLNFAVPSSAIESLVAAAGKTVPVTGLKGPVVPEVFTAEGLLGDILPDEYRAALDAPTIGPAGLQAFEAWLTATVASKRISIIDARWGETETQPDAITVHLTRAVASGTRRYYLAIRIVLPVPLPPGAAGKALEVERRKVGAHVNVRGRVVSVQVAMGAEGIRRRDDFGVTERLEGMTFMERYIAQDNRVAEGIAGMSPQQRLVAGQQLGGMQPAGPRKPRYLEAEKGDFFRDARGIDLQITLEDWEATDAMPQREPWVVDESTTKISTPATQPAPSPEDIEARRQVEELKRRIERSETARRQLQLAETYLANGMSGKAREVLLKIMADYRDAPAAEEAKRLLDSME